MRWQAFDSVHGLDDERQEFQFARFASYYAEHKGDKKRPLDFCPYRKRREQSVDEAMASLETLEVSK